MKGEGEAGGDRSEVSAAQLEVALLDRGRPHRTFRRLTGARLETLLAGAIGGRKTEAIAEARRPEAGGAAEAGGAERRGGRGRWCAEQRRSRSGDSPA